MVVLRDSDGIVVVVKLVGVLMYFVEGGGSEFTFMDVAFLCFDG